MKITVHRFRDLSARDLMAWRRIQSEDERYASPYFCPSYTQCVDRIRSDVFVARMGANTDPVGFFPFQKNLLGVGRHIGGALTDYQGVVVREGVDWSPIELLKRCRIHYIRFDHMIATQHEFRPFVLGVAQSPVIDLTDGLDIYVEEQRRSGSGQWKKIGNFRRRLEREHGQIRFVADLRDTEAMEQLLAWKSSQCLASGGVDFTRIPWVRSLLHEIWGCQVDGFRGILSGLYAGETLVAAHFGMIGAGTWHYWFPGYRREVSKCSPGLVLLAEIMGVAADHEVRRIDLGKGEDPYKMRWRNRSIAVAEGQICLEPSLVGTATSGYQFLRQQIGQGPWPAAGRAMDRAMAAIERKVRFR